MYLPLEKFVVRLLPPRLLRKEHNIVSLDFRNKFLLRTSPWSYAIWMNPESLHVVFVPMFPATVNFSIARPVSVCHKLVRWYTSDFTEAGPSTRTMCSSNHSEPRLSWQQVPVKCPAFCTAETLLFHNSQWRKMSISGLLEFLCWFQKWEEDITILV